MAEWFKRIYGDDISPRDLLLTVALVVILAALIF